MKINDFFLGDGCDLNFELINSLDEIKALKTAEQNPKWHAEGNAYEHTMKCVEHALMMCKNSLSSLFIKRRLIVAVLLHDIGKPDTTQFIKENWHSYGHEFVGEQIARKMLWDEKIEERERVCCLIRNHMSVLHAFNTDISVMLRNMSKYMPNPFFDWEDEIFVKRCDLLGSIQEDEPMYRKDNAKLSSLLWASNYLTKCRNQQLTYNMLYFEYNNLDKKPTATFLIGLPGAGKDTYSKSLNGIVLCRDDIRAELGYCKEGEKYVGSNEEENNVSKIFNERLIEALKNGHNVVINNINLKKKYRDEIKTLILNSGIKVRYNYVYIETRLENNLKRRPTIGKEIFDRMIRTFDWPEYKEYDNFQIITN